LIVACNKAMRKFRYFLAFLAALSLCVEEGAAQRNKNQDSNTRSVEGVVEDPRGLPVVGAVVQLKNTKTLQVRSFITQKEGRYYFYGLSPDVEYELRAEYKDLASPVRRLSVFDTRRKVVINLRLASQN